jgi:hypothetical protein
MFLDRLASTSWITARRELSAVDALVGAPHRILRATTGAWARPALSERLPVPLALAELVRALSGRLVVTNPCAVVRLPWAAGALARAVLRRALGGAAEPPPLGASGPIPLSAAEAREAVERRRVESLLAHLPDEVRARLAPGSATWGGVALYEPTELAVQLDAGSTAVAPEPLPMSAVIRYRLALALGRGAPPPDWRALDEAVETTTAVHWPPARESTLWFAVRVLVPDAVATRGMDAQDLARWAELSGRGGPSSRDQYWYTDSWERFREPGRLVGHITPADVGRSRRGADVGGEETSAGLALTPAAERGVCAPPGYCLVDCAGTLEIAVVAP